MNRYELKFRVTNQLMEVHRIVPVQSFKVMLDGPLQKVFECIDEILCETKQEDFYAYDFKIETYYKIDGGDQ